MRQIKSMRLLGLLTVGALAVALAACGDDSDDGDDADTATGADEGEAPELDLVSDGQLTVCSDVPYEPWEFQDDDGEWTGFDLELMREIATRLDLEMVVSEQEFDGIWLAPQAGDCDIVASAMTITEERAENALFSDGYFEADQSLLVRAEDEGEFETLDDLDGETIGTQQGTTGFDYATENAPEGADVEEYLSESDAFADLDSGQIEAVVQDLPANGYRAQESDAYAVVETYTTDEDYGFATSQDNEALIEEVNTALADIREEGIWDELFAEWIPQEWYGEGAEGAEAEDAEAEDEE